MTTVEYFALAGLCVMAALCRRCDHVTVTLAFGLIASIVVINAVPGVEVLPYLAAIDAFTCMAMAVVWVQCTSMRAWAVGFISLAKCAWTMAAAVNVLQVGTYSYSAPINIGYIAQILIAGGFVDVVGHWLDNLRRRTVLGRVVVLRNGEA